MTDTDDSPPSSSSPESDPAPAPRVISLAERRRRLPARSPTEKLMRSLLALVEPGPATTANEIQLEPQPDWSALRTRLEQMDLDNVIALETRDAARGEGSPVRLRSLRSLRAMRSFERGDRDGACQEWQALFDEEPQNTGPLMTRALFFRGEKEYDTALADYDRAATLQPKDPAIYEGRGRCFELRGDRERALLEYRRLVHLRPRNRQALHSLASCLRFSGDLDGAIRVFGRALKLFPWRADLYGERAACYRTKGLRAEELVDLDQCIERDPKNAAAFRERAWAHAHFKDEDRELADLTRVIELDPRQVGAFQRRALLHEKRGQIDLAIADLSFAVELKPDSVALLKSRAAACMRAGAFDRAVADLSDVISLERGHSTSTFWLRGDAHRKSGDAKSALRDYEEAMWFDDELFDKLVQSERRKRNNKLVTAEHRDELDTLMLLAPEDPEYFVVRARIFEAAGEHEKAIADLDQAIALDPDRSDFFHARAMVLIHLGECARAVEDESRAIALAPFEALSYAWRGMLRFFEEGPSAEAEVDVRRAVELAPDDLVTLQFLARYLAGTGRHEEALSVHDQRVTFYPDYGFLYANRGEARLQRPHDEATLRAALADFDRALELGGQKEEVFQQRAAVRALLGDPAPQ